METVTSEERCRVIGASIEGNPIRSTLGMTAIAKSPIMKRLAEISSFCAEYRDKHIRVWFRSHKNQNDPLPDFSYYLG